MKTEYIGGVLIVFCLCLVGCESSSANLSEGEIDREDPQTCEGCHTNETVLKKYASESSSLGGGGG